jgi:hypothetical protein
VCPLYTSVQQQLLSTGIAGGKWSIQIIAAYFLLADKKWRSIKNIGGTCLIGSLILLPYAMMTGFSGNDSAVFCRLFIGSRCCYDRVLFYQCKTIRGFLHMVLWLDNLFSLYHQLTANGCIFGN